MKSIPRLALVAGLMLVLPAFVWADEETVPSFRSVSKRETKEFVTKVGGAIIKVARAKPQKIELEKYEYTSPKAGRTELVMKMHYHGLVTKQKYTADITVIIDSADKDKWEVLNVRYKDNNKSIMNPNEKKIQELIKEFNK